MAKAKDESQDHGIHDQSHGKAKTKTEWFSKVYSNSGHVTFQIKTYIYIYLIKYYLSKHFMWGVHLGKPSRQVVDSRIKVSWLLERLLHDFWIMSTQKVVSDI